MYMWVASMNSYVFENDYYFKYLLNTFTGIILLTGIAYLCYPQKKTNQENELVLNEYKLVYETESTASQYFISDTEAWNTLRKQLKTTAQGHAILYISESCELPIINNMILAKKRNFDCWKPACAGQISKILVRFKVIIKKYMAAIKRFPWKGNVNYLKIRGIILNWT